MTGEIRTQHFQKLKLLQTAWFIIAEHSCNNTRCIRSLDTSGVSWMTVVDSSALTPLQIGCQGFCEIGGRVKRESTLCSHFDLYGRYNHRDHSKMGYEINSLFTCNSLASIILLTRWKCVCTFSVFSRLLQASLYATFTTSSCTVCSVPVIPKLKR